MANTKSGIKDWNLFATNPTAPENHITKAPSDHENRGSTVFKETFVEKVINNEGEVLSKTRSTKYTGLGGIELTKDDYIQAKAKDNEGILELARRRELERGEQLSAARPATINPSQIKTEEIKPFTSRPASDDSLSASWAPTPCLIKPEEIQNSVGRPASEAGSFTTCWAPPPCLVNEEEIELSNRRPTSKDSYPVCWNPPLCNSSPISRVGCQRMTPVPPHLRSGPVIPLATITTSQLRSDCLPSPQSTFVPTHGGGRFDSSVPPHLRGGPIFTQRS